MDTGKHDLLRTIPTPLQQELMRCAMQAKLPVDDLVQHLLGRAVPSNCPDEQLDGAVATLSPDLRAALQQLAPKWALPVAQWVLYVEGAQLLDAETLERVLRVELAGRRLPVCLDVPVAGADGAARVVIRYTWDTDRTPVAVKLSADPLAKLAALFVLPPAPASPSADAAP